MSGRNKILLAVGAAMVAAALWSTLGQDYQNVKFREIEPAKPFYLNRKGEAWRAHSRIVGCLRNPPAEFTLTVVNVMTMQNVRTETHSGAFTVYETQWLPPGRYDIVFGAEGFMSQKAKGVQLKAGTDCFINLYFNPTVYRR